MIPGARPSGVACPPGAPDQSKEARDLCGLAALCIACLIPYLGQPLKYFDEGFLLCGFERVMLGEIPYRDFWSMYGPGQHLLLGGLFKLFGPSVVAERCAGIATALALVLVTFHFLRGRAGRLWAWLGALGVLSTCIGLNAFYYPSYASALFMLVSLHCMGAHVEKQNRPALLLSAMWAGVAALFRFELGGMFLFGMLLFLAIDSALSPEPGKKGPRALGTTILLFFTVVMAVAIPVYYYCLKNTTTDIIRLMFEEYPLSLYKKYRSIDISTLMHLIKTQRKEAGAWNFIIALRDIYIRCSLYLATPLSVALIMAAIGRIYKKGASHAAPQSRFFLLLTGSLTLGISQIIVRTDATHHVLLFVFVLITLAYMLGNSPPKSVQVRRICLALFAFIALGLLHANLLRWTSNYASIAKNLDSKSPIPRLAPYIPLDADLAKVILYVRENCMSHPLYVGVENHDKFIINHPEIYFLAAAGYGTYFHELDPGIMSLPAMQHRVVDDIEKRRVATVVLSSKDDFWDEDNLSGQDAGLDILDRHIREHFAEVARVGTMIVMARKP